ncbi:hypothetical protein K439DRAFT_1617395 [Ramaria rubella]|nr:hypothetical protein K439DRAFT_1617395 [Ramaria rubella]
MTVADDYREALKKLQFLEVLTWNNPNEDEYATEGPVEGLEDHIRELVERMLQTKFLAESLLSLSRVRHYLHDTEETMQIIRGDEIEVTRLDISEGYEVHPKWRISLTALLQASSIHGHYTSAWSVEKYSNV